MFKPRYYQEDCYKAVLSELKAEESALAVLPTGAGKSAVIAMLCNLALNSNRNALVLTHSKELIVQNHAELKKFFGYDTGIYSASVGQKDTGRQITFGGIQSVFRKPELFAPHLVIVDEAHLLSPEDDTMYRKFLSALPQHKLVGLTATPYRMKQGLLTEGDNALFQDICYEIGIGELVRKGYLSPLSTFGTKTQRDMSDVKTVAGEFKLDEMAKKFEGDEIVKITCDEMLARTQDRNKILIFASSLLHADQIAEYLNCSRGFICYYIDGEMSQDEREGKLHSFQNEKSPCAIVNYGILTTGFNVPSIDCIALMRATQSTGLYVQMLGRGTRKSEGKENCLVLDFGGNIERHGPVDAIEIKPKKEGEGKELVVQPTKMCPECMADNHLRAATCHYCGHVFPVAEKIVEKPEQQKAVMKETVTYTVTGWRVKRHAKPGKTPSMRVVYDVEESFFPVSEWVCVEHKGYAREKAEKWFTERGINPPNNVHEAIHITDDITPPAQIRVEVGGKFPQIKNRIFA